MLRSTEVFFSGIFLTNRSSNSSMEALIRTCLSFSSSPTTSVFLASSSGSTSILGGSAPSALLYTASSGSVVPTSSRAPFSVLVRFAKMATVVLTIFLLDLLSLEASLGRSSTSSTSRPTAFRSSNLSTTALTISSAALVAYSSVCRASVEAASSRSKLPLSLLSSVSLLSLADSTAWDAPLAIRKMGFSTPASISPRAWVRSAIPLDTTLTASYFTSARF
mmetsp:Transcript_17882/g.37422  ORF Transcript_17882/g.37422 Transcript_17882/m.37422 type:complete len:221 (-) Transcript_17882:162-824(-)